MKNRMMRPGRSGVCCSLWLVLCLSASAQALDVRDFGAKGDGVSIDSPAINAAIAAAAKGEGGGLVVVPEGTYLCYSLHLQTGVTLRLDEGAVLKAAAPSDTLGFDAAEPAESAFQDFGHSHWHNSLLWGEHLQHVTLEGGGLIDGTDVLLRDGNPRGARSTRQADKALALRQCEHVVVRGLRFLNCGHFAMLMTGVDHMLIEHVTVDTNRDGIDIDCCEHVRMQGCRVNTLSDDAIVLKCSFALGYAKPTADVQITDCHVSGYDPGSLMEGTCTATRLLAPDGDGPTGRIKLGTESTGGFRDITIARCTFTRSRGLALETVDGACMENIRVSDVTMNDICNSPIYICVGSRMRAPEGFHPSMISGIHINNVQATDVDARYAFLITGTEGECLRDVHVTNLSVSFRGGLTPDDVACQRGANPFFFSAVRPASGHGVTDYPEPSAHGVQPAWGLCIYRARDVELAGIRLETMHADGRPWAYYEDVSNIHLRDVVVKNGERELRIEDDYVNEKNGFQTEDDSY